MAVWLESQGPPFCFQGRQFCSFSVNAGTAMVVSGLGWGRCGADEGQRRPDCGSGMWRSGDRSGRRELARAGPGAWEGLAASRPGGGLKAGRSDLSHSSTYPRCVALNKSLRLLWTLGFTTKN